MKYFFAILILCCVYSANAQSKKQSATIKGTVEIGPLCPAEPCNLSKKEKQEIYQSYEVILLDTAGNIQFHIPIKGAKFEQVVPPGIYTALIKPLDRKAVRAERLDFTIRNRETFTFQLRYDTGIR
jgi:hypothetical protein